MWSAQKRPRDDDISSSLNSEGSYQRTHSLNSLVIWKTAALFQDLIVNVGGYRTWQMMNGRMNVCLIAGFLSV